MESSRVFVKNLPPTISEAEFRNHFSAQGREVTDIKLFPNRRIGFVGYKSHEDAAKAVKYFNKTFIRLSRISVDLAKPIVDSKPKFPAAKDEQRHDGAGISSRKPDGTGVDQTDDEKSKKRKREALEEADPKLQEYLEVMGHPVKKPRDREVVGIGQETDSVAAVPPAVIEAGESDDEYEDIPSLKPKGGAKGDPAPVEAAPAAVPDGEGPTPAAGDVPVREVPKVAADATDDDWLRSRTNRLLDLVDPDDPEFAARAVPSAPAAATTHAPEPKDSAGVETATDADSPNQGAPVPAEDTEDAIKQIEKTRRLFLRNLGYTVTEDDIQEHFSKFGALEEVNLPLDSRGRGKGFAMIRYEQPAAAVAAFQTDGSIFQGRIIHIIPGSAKREKKLDEFALSKLPHKKQQLLKKKAEAASSTFNWNSLFMSQDAVNTAVAERLGISKHELLDPTDASAAVKQAVAETTVIQEAKAYFAAHGVNIEAFKSQQRGDTAILVKNIKNTSIEELRSLFEEHGTVVRVLMPPGGTIAIVQFAQPAACRAAFAKKAYSRFKDSVLFLEKGPKGLFVDNAAPPQEPQDRPAGVQKPSVADLLERDDDEDQQLETTSLYVRNLNFSTTAEGLTNAFKHLDGFVSATVKTKKDPKRPGQVLSMGFGFCAFRTKEQAQAALKVMDGYVLDAHKLSVKASHRGHDAAEERRREDLAKKAAAQRTKIVIKNLPFEATKKDVRALFSAYGKLVALRLPKKFNSMSRGFAFAEFATAKEALNALTALKDTHLLGRRLVLDFAEADEVDPEEQIKAMEKKMRGQVNKVTLQKLTGEGRKRINIGDKDEDEA
ncbi:RNA-binding domain-containing protein [Thermothelomyces heterothallicus CBS 203.75]